TGGTTMRLTLCGLASLLACTMAAAAPRDDALAIVDLWAAAFAASDVDAIARLYADDATFIGTSSTAVLSGREAIRGYFDRALNQDRPRGAILRERVVTEVSPRQFVVTGLDTTTRTRNGQQVDAPGRVS